MKIYAIKDMKGDFGTQLFVLSNNDQAIRTIPYIKQQSELMQRYPEDFALYCLGDYNFDSGAIKSDLPEYVCLLSEERKNNENLA